MRERNNNIILPEAEWLPPHRLVFISAISRENGNTEIPVCFKSLYDLLKNPDFNRFDYNNIIQAGHQEFLTSSKNMTIAFISNVNAPRGESHNMARIVTEVSEDIDALIQLMTILNHKLRDIKGIDFKVYLNHGEKKSGLHLFYSKLGLKVVESDFNELFMIVEDVVYIVAYRTLVTFQYQLEPMIRIISDEEWLKWPELKGDKKKNLLVEVHDILTDEFIQALMKEIYDSF